MNALPKVGFLTALLNGFKNYINFRGRTRRSEYWYFLLVTNIITCFFIILLILFFEKVIYKTNYNPADYPDYDLYENFADHKHTEKILIIIGVFAGFIAIVMLPVISATVRRLHDIGKSGLFIFIALLPVIGDLVLIYFLCQDSEERLNEYGPSPKYSLDDNNNNSGNNYNKELMFTQD